MHKHENKLAWGVVLPREIREENMSPYTFDQRFRFEFPVAIPEFQEERTTSRGIRKFSKKLLPGIFFHPEFPKFSLNSSFYKFNQQLSDFPENSQAILVPVVSFP